MLHINDLSFRIGPRLLIDHATVALADGAKTGLVGRNGSGKTTLFRLITGELIPETGSIGLPRNARIGQVAQEAPAGDESLIAVVLAADRERAALLEEAETAADAHRIADIQTRLADIDAHSAEARAAAILAGLGFDTAAQQRPCSSFSGGWRMRVALAAVLFAEPDLLLLDEPTNYLDLEGTLWLESYLSRYPRGVLLISHDRDLLNRAVDGIVHLDQGKLVYYRGGYDQFDRQRRERQALQLKMRKKQEDQRRHMEAFVERFRSKASKARQAQSRLKALARLEPIVDDRQRGDLPVLLSRSGQADGAADRRHGGGRGRLRPRTPGPQKTRPQDRRRRSHRPPRGERQRQVDFRQAHRRPPAADRRHVPPPAQSPGRVFRPAPARRTEPGALRL